MTSILQRREANGHTELSMSNGDASRIASKTVSPTSPEVFTTPPAPISSSPTNGRRPQTKEYLPSPLSAALLPSAGSSSSSSLASPALAPERDPQGSPSKGSPMRDSHLPYRTTVSLDRTSSENAAVSIIAMYTDHTPIEEKDEPTSSNGPSNPRENSLSSATRPESFHVNGVKSYSDDGGSDSRNQQGRNSNSNSNGTHESAGSASQYPYIVHHPADGSNPVNPSGRAQYTPEHLNLTESRASTSEEGYRGSLYPQFQDSPPSRASGETFASQAKPQNRFTPRTQDSPNLYNHPLSTSGSHSSSLFPSTPFTPDVGGRIPKVSKSAISLSTAHSQPKSHRGADEEADAEYVRSIYNRFEEGGVPGDGFTEGLERTRARLPSSGSQDGSLAAAAAEAAERVASGGLTSKEDERLRNLDRYGFFIDASSTRQENRLILLPAAPLAKKAKRLKTPTGVRSRISLSPRSKPSPNAPPEVKSVPKEQNPTKELARLSKWQKMMRATKHDSGGNAEMWAHDGQGTSDETFRSRVWKGIPDRWRPAAWQMLVNEAASRSTKSVAQENLLSQYRRDVDEPSSHDVQIDLDVPRTVSNHVSFHTRYGQGQRALFHVLHCFSLYCGECEYVQGMGPIAANLLSYMDPERAYIALVRMHDIYQMHAVFKPGFPGLLEAIYVQERLVESIMPDVYKTLQSHMISTTSFATKWYITLFANSVPFQTQLRIWDAFFLEGRDTIVVVAVAIIWVLKENITAPSATFESILSLLSSFFVIEDEDALLSWIRSTMRSSTIRNQMGTWRKDWRALVSSGKQGTALL